MALTIGFGALFAVNANMAYGRIYDATLMQAAPEMETLIQQQSRNFVVTSACLGVAYVIAVFVGCIAYTNRVIGPSCRSDARWRR